MAFPADYTLLGKISTNTALISGTHTGLPLIITEAAFNNGDDIRSAVFGNTDNGGGDVRLSTDAAGLTQLPLEVVEWDTIGNTCVIHTSRDVNGTTSADIYIWGNNTGDTQPSVTGTYGRDAVWSDYESVNHFENTVDSSGTTPNQTLSGTASITSLGIIGSGLSLGNLGKSSVSNSNIGLASTDKTRISFWVNRTTDNSTSSFDENYVSLYNSGISDGLIVGVFQNKLVIYTAGGNTTSRTGATTLALSTDYKLEIVWDQVAQTVEHYVNGVLDGSAVTSYTDTSVAAAATSVYTVGDSPSSSDIGLNGLIDEVYYTKSITSANAISTQYNNENSLGTFFTSSSTAGGITVTGTAPSYSYTAVSATVDLTGEITVTGTTPSYSYTAVNATVDLTGTITVTGATPSYSYTAVNANALLQGTISVTGQTPTYSYSAVNCIVQIGGVELATSFSGQFKESEFGNTLRASEFEGNFKESEFGDMIKTSVFSGIIKESGFSGSQK